VCTTFVCGAIPVGARLAREDGPPDAKDSGLYSYQKVPNMSLHLIIGDKLYSSWSLRAALALT